VDFFQIIKNLLAQDGYLMLPQVSGIAISAFEVFKYASYFNVILRSKAASSRMLFTNHQPNQGTGTLIDVRLKDKLYGEVISVEKKHLMLQGPVNTDDRPVLEYAALRKMNKCLDLGLTINNLNNYLDKW